MGARFPEPKTVRGTRFVPMLLIGFVLFAILGIGGTLLFGRLFLPSSPKAQAQARALSEQRARELQR